MTTMTCEKCGAECKLDHDLEVGFIDGPLCCAVCGWSEDRNYDRSKPHIVELGSDHLSEHFWASFYKSAPALATALNKRRRAIVSHGVLQSIADAGGFDVLDNLQTPLVDRGAADDKLVNVAIEKGRLFEVFA